jgi:hypothetical protein
MVVTYCTSQILAPVNPVERQYPLARFSVRWPVATQSASTDGWYPPVITPHWYDVE